jgi:DNA-binding transcriptional LysR family regulator
MGSQMEMHQVRYFVALCEEQSFTRAAKRCGVSQPSLTNAIRRLEEELGGSLFDRRKTGIRLLPLGTAVRPYLYQIDRSAEDAKRKATNVLTVGLVSTFTTIERPVRKIIYGTGVTATVLLVEALLVAVLLIRRHHPATASTQTQASDIVNVRALESTIDIKALPRQNLN